MLEKDVPSPYVTLNTYLYIIHCDWQCSSFNCAAEHMCIYIYIYTVHLLSYMCRCMRSLELTTREKAEQIVGHRYVSVGISPEALGGSGGIGFSRKSSFIFYSF